ncbi:hypothetical protein BDZ91DRAFT_764479 [Kalaharituber pfeilii]|nr:hypothetical protein BDZ91DRAFT_764479 [Kalaharituber pfeilii]
MARETKNSGPITIDWSDAEKIHLLLEIIHESKIVPNWNAIKLPQGRTLPSAKTEFLKMSSEFPLRARNAEEEDDEDEEEYEAESKSTSPPPAQKKQRREKSSSDDEGSASSGEGGSSSNNSENGTSNSATAAEGWTKTSSSSSKPADPSNPSTFPIKRKRGRPTKAEAEARKAAIARGELPPPKPPSYTPVSTPVFTVGPDGVHRRRRGRPSKAEVAARKAAEAAGTLIPSSKKK